MPRTIRPIRIEGNVAYVTLTRGYEAVIDAHDVTLVSGENWKADVNLKPNGEIRAVYARQAKAYGALGIHKILMNPPEGYVVDHIDGNPLNNTRANMRLVTTSQNSCNKKIGLANTSGYKGVCFDKKRNKWVAQIKINRKKFNLGFFIDPADAAKAYARASAEIHGEYGRLR